MKLNSFYLPQRLKLNHTINTPSLQPNSTIKFNKQQAHSNPYLRAQAAILKFPAGNAIVTALTNKEGQGGREGRNSKELKASRPPININLLIHHSHCLAFVTRSRYCSCMAHVFHLPRSKWYFIQKEILSKTKDKTFCHT